MHKFEGGFRWGPKEHPLGSRKALVRGAKDLALAYALSYYCFFFFEAFFFAAFFLAAMTVSYG